MPKTKSIRKKATKPTPPKEEEKKIKAELITLDRGTDGQYITCLNHYYNTDPNRWFTTDDAVILLRKLVSKSSLEKYRRYNKDDQGERGPQFHPFSARVIKYKARWLVRFREGLPWEKPVVELKPQYTVTASNIPSKASAISK